MSRRIIPPTAIAVNRPASSGPVVVSIPHAGRIYPPEILAIARVGRAELERLEDRWCDLIAGAALDAGATVVQALWARAVVDCNRGEGQMAPGEVTPRLRSQFSAPGRKERAGLGVVPTRLADCGPLWKAPIDGEALQWRLESMHRPYHAALAEVLAAARDRYGHAILIDLHSMPTIPAGQPGHGAQVVVGDRFGSTAAPWLSETAMDEAGRLGVHVSHNQPYAGGHVVRTHGRPASGVNAIQIEIDRALYLAPDRSPDPVGVAQMTEWFARLVKTIEKIRPADDRFPVAAE